jgi:hypothetical protein
LDIVDACFPRFLLVVLIAFLLFCWVLPIFTQCWLDFNISVGDAVATTQPLAGRLGSALALGEETGESRFFRFQGRMIHLP